MAIYRGSGGSGTAGDKAAADQIAIDAAAAAASASAAASSETAAAASAAAAASSAASVDVAAITTTVTTDATANVTTNLQPSVNAAASSAAAALASETSASADATAAALAKNEAEAVLQALYGTYLGVSATEPTVDGNGDPLTSGDWYYNSSNGNNYIYDGSAWQIVISGTGIASVVADTAPQLGGDLDANSHNIDMGVNVITDTAVGQWIAAYGWGNHASAGYASASSLATVATSGSYADLSGTPSLATVATSGSYADLSNKPTIPTNNNQLTNGAGYTTYTANQAVNTSSSPTFVTLNATTVDLGNWTVTESSGVLYFASSGTNRMKLDASGNLTVTGNVTAYGTV